MKRKKYFDWRKWDISSLLLIIIGILQLIINGNLEITIGILLILAGIYKQIIGK